MKYFCETFVKEHLKEPIYCYLLLENLWDNAADAEEDTLCC
ncbi:unnamed protein product [Brassica oleracea]